MSSNKAILLSVLCTPVLVFYGIAYANQQPIVQPPVVPINEPVVVVTPINPGKIFDMKKDYKPERFTIIKRNMECLAHAIYHEARGESEYGQRAVGYVAVNRAKAIISEKPFYDNLCRIVYAPNQFTDLYASNLYKVKNKAEFKKAYKIALQVVSSAQSKTVNDITYGADHYYAPKAVKKTPKWSYNFKKTTTIGNHVFFQSKLALSGGNDD